MCAPTNLYSPQTRSISVRKQIMLNVQSKRVYERIVTGAAARSAAGQPKAAPTIMILYISDKLRAHNVRPYISDLFT